METDEPFVEESWPGRTLDVGSVRLRVEERIERCRTIDLAQDGVATTTRWLKALGGSRDLCVGIYARVDQPGEIAVGDHCPSPLTRPKLSGGSAGFLHSSGPFLWRRADDLWTAADRAVEKSVKVQNPLICWGFLLRAAPPRT